MRRVVAAVALLALLLGATAGGLVVAYQWWDARTDGPGRELQGEDSAPASATEPPVEQLSSFYSQSIDWKECGNGFDCGWLKVPLDYEEPQGEAIDVRLLKRRASTDQRIGSLVVNPGGPGAPGTEYAASAEAVFRQPLLDHFDIVGFDPRGTGASRPIDCLSDEELTAQLDADPTPDTPQAVTAAVASVEDFFAGCSELSGDLVDHVSTAEAARDLDVLRAALGQDQLDYFGASYGTQLGATYAELFPDRVGYFVLDGAIDVSADNVERSLVQAGGFETALRAYVQNCLDQGDCQLGDSMDDALKVLRGLVDQASSDPLPAGQDRTLGSGSAFYGIVMPLYNRKYWPLLDVGLEKALAGDGSGLMMLADLYASRGPDGYRDNSSEAIIAINCLDDPSTMAVEAIPDQFPAFDEASPTFGRIFAWGLMGCKGFTGRTVEPLEIDGAGAAPIVVTGTTRDPATPMVWAEALAEQLESGVLVRRDGDGHTAYNAQNTCVDEAIEGYLIDGTVPEDGLSC